MSKKRMVHDCLWRSEGFADLSFRQRLLWIGLITTADDQGRGRAHPGLIRAAIFPFDVISQEEIEEDLAAIIDADMAVVYEAEGKAYYQVANWWDYQSPQWVGPSDYPAPDGWDDRLRFHGKGHKIITQNWPGSDDSLPDKSGDNKADKSPSKPGFERGKGKGKGKEEDNTAAILSDILSEWARLFPDKPQPNLTTKSLRDKTRTRWKVSDFRDTWKKALARAAHSEFCNSGSWFTLHWFMKNDENWRKCADGNYDDAERVSSQSTADAGGWNIPG